MASGHPSDALDITNIGLRKRTAKHFNQKIAHSTRKKAKMEWICKKQERYKPKLPTFAGDEKPLHLWN